MEVKLGSEPFRSIIISEEHYQKMLELGVYEQWKFNVKDQHSDDDFNEDFRDRDFYYVIDYSFYWVDTEEGNDFWSDIANSN